MALPLDLITGALSFLFTLLILSYLIGDNPFFRIGVYTFVGVSAGYVASVSWWQAIWPRLIQPLLIDPATPPIEKAFLAIPLLLSGLILMKVLPQLANLGGIAMAFIVGVGAAVTIVGAVSGTLLLQTTATINAFSLAAADPATLIQNFISGGVILLGTVFSLSYFHFGARPSKTDGAMRRAKIFELAAWVGRIFIGITLGAIFAGVFSAALSAFVERIYSLIVFIEDLLIGFGIL